MGNKKKLKDFMQSLKTEDISRFLFICVTKDSRVASGCEGSMMDIVALLHSMIEIIDQEQPGFAEFFQNTYPFIRDKADTFDDDDEDEEDMPLVN